ncbi:DinB family protein [uncultured Kriegella sp.]|uniref:DinB family protein n=1 Tax=uncultured Kriegella sp. TaxID=1798910 RepID=UPI0030DD7DBA
MTTKPNGIEAWLRGPIHNIPLLLQPAAHALIQSQEEVKRYTQEFPEELLWKQPVGRASVGFHLQHLTGVVDRLLTYAKGSNLSELQLQALRNEGNAETKTTIAELVELFEHKVNEALSYFKSLADVDLTQARTVGRKQLPTTLIGLLFHAAEHSQRHVGQLLVTVSTVQAMNNRK